MRVKSYYSASVEAAIAQARQELGPEAMLLNSRRAMPEARHLGEYEVVFASPAGDRPAAAETTDLTHKQKDPTVDRLSQEVSELRRQLERTASMFQRASAIANSPVANNAEYLEMFSSLVGSEVDAELAHRILKAARTASEAAPAVTLEQAVHHQIAQLLTTSSDLGTAAPGPKVVALTGPPGVGKTATLVKIAVRYGIARHQRVQLLSLDVDRVGAAEQLRSFAAVLGVGFEVIPPSALDHMLGRYGHHDLILIDTPGFDSKHADLFTDLTRVVAGDARIDTHLVLSASMKAADLDRTCQRYLVFRPAKLLFTRLDETCAYGAIVNQVVARRLPLSFLCSGQSVPEDLVAADAQRVAGLVLDAGLPRAEMAAA
jgi:flagellar biosynthesis protein FlhF